MRHPIRCALVVLAALLVLAGGLAAQSTESAAALLRAAIDQATVDGDLKGAIKQYQAIVQKFSGDRGIVATALVRMAVCYQKLGDAEARTIYERVVREFADQPAAVEEARGQLTTLRMPALGANRGQALRLVWSGQDAFGSVRGSISPDGRFLTYLDQATRGGLAIRDLKDNTSRVLAQADGGSMYYAVFSPDGRRVAYTWATQSGREIRFDLRVVSASGVDSPRVVYRNEEMLFPRPFGWTPDAKHVLLLRSLRDGTNQIAFIGVEDGSTVVLKSIPWNYATLSLSPDGRFVAHDSIVGEANAPSEIFVIATDGSRETKIVSGPGVNSSPIWSPDGSRLLFISDRTGARSLWAVPMHDGRPAGPPALVKEAIGSRLQGITRDGTLYYLVSGASRSNVYVADLDATTKISTPPVIVSERFVNQNSAPVWSPDGERLAYLSLRGESGVALVIRGLKAGDERHAPLPKEVLTGNLVPGPRWFPDGRSLLLFGFVGNSAGLYYRVDAETGQAKIVHQAKGVSGNGGLGAFVISADGRSFFYIASQTTPHQGKTNLVQLDLETKHETIVASGTFNAVAISPDGWQLALHRHDGTPGGCHVDVMPAAGGELRSVVRTGNCNPNRLAWAPNGSLLFVRGGNAEPNVLWRVPAAGGSEEEIGASMRGQLMHPTAHPDGRRIAFGVFETAASEVWALENFLPARPKTSQTAKK